MLVTIKNKAESTVAILRLIDQTREKMAGLPIAQLAWRPSSPESSDNLAAMVTPALDRCKDVTETVIVMTVASVWTAVYERLSEEEAAVIGKGKQPTP